MCVNESALFLLIWRCFCYCVSVARWQFSPQHLDNSGRFESCLAGKKNISGGWAGGFVADLTNSAKVFFCLADLADFESLFQKNKKIQTFSCHKQIMNKNKK
jgi:hypothetical protein